MRSKLSLALAVLVSLAALTTASDAPGPGPTGTWVVNVNFQGIDLLTYLQQFTRDGRASIILASGTATSNPPGFPETRSACVGDWRPAHGRDFDLTLYCLWADQVSGAIPDRIRCKGTLAKDGEHFDGSFTYEKWDPVGGEYHGGFGSMAATRLGIVPFD
jgi:hypothetical protein